MKRRLIHLHVHSEHSILDGAIKLQQLVEIAARRKSPYVAVTDHGNIDCYYHFNKLCKEADVKPVFGCELYVVDPTQPKIERVSRSGRRHWTEVQRYHLSAYPRSMKGLKNLMRLLTIGWLPENISRNRPCVPYQKLLEFGEDITISTGCASSLFWNHPKGDKLLRQFVKAFGADNVLAEVQPLHDFPQQLELNRRVLTAAGKLDLPPIATSDAHFVNPGDTEFHQVLLAVGTHQKWGDPNRWKFDTRLNYLHTTAQMEEGLSASGLTNVEVKASVRNTLAIAERLSFELEEIPVQLPHVLDKDVDKENTLMFQQAKRKLKKMGLTSSKYKERLDMELNFFAKHEFCRYMLLVADMVQWAKSNDVMVGPGRGSVGGSLVAYALHITTVDPLAHDLNFSRFCSEGRVDLPDIDLDFEDRKRGRVIQYLKQRWGSENVANVSTHAAMHGKQAIRSVGKVFEIPELEIGDFARCIIERSKEDARASFGIQDAVKVFRNARHFADKYPRVIANAQKMEGLVKSVGIHAAGVVVANEPLTRGRHAVIVRRKKDAPTAVNWDKKSLEHFGLMKLDILGLRFLSVLKTAVDMIEIRHDKRIVLEEINLDDPKPLRLLDTGQTAGIFQIQGPGPTTFAKELKVERFKELAALGALWRPGCLKVGIPTMYVNRKFKRERVKYVHPIHQQITKETYGLIIYQEQVMYLLTKLAGIPWDKADQVRKVISKREGLHEMRKFREEFANGCVARKTITRKEAYKLYDNLKFFSMYAFNKIHSVEYAMITFWCLSLKHHYITEFFAACLANGAHEVSDFKRSYYFGEIVSSGLEVLSPDVNLSIQTWEPAAGKSIRSGLLEIKGLGPKAADELVRARNTLPKKRFETLPQLVETVMRRVVNRGKIKLLGAAGALDSLVPEIDRLSLRADPMGYFEWISREEKKRRK